MTHLALRDEALSFERLGDLPRALGAYQRLLLLAPEDKEAWVEYGVLLFSAKQAAGAQDAFTRCLELDGDFIPALVFLGKLFLQLGHLEEAASSFHRAIALAPGQTDIRLHLARCHWNQGDLQSARVALMHAVEWDPANPLVTRFLLDVLVRLEDWPGLHREMLRRATLDYSGPSREWELCCVNLLFGSMEEGWRQHESRWSNPALTNPKPNLPQPRWDGCPLEGKSILLHWEQGFGDTLMFVRYAPRVKALGGRVIVLCQPEVAGLVATCPGVDQVVAQGDPLPTIDCYLPMMSLPYVFKTDLASIPAEVPYLEVPKEVPNLFGLSKCLAAVQNRRRIGLSWAGNPNHARDGQRSIVPATFRPLEALPGIAWFSFQRGAADLPPLPGIVSLEPLLCTFTDTAFALRGLDLLITVDTAIAHLAGALGVPTLLLVSYLPDWRWLLGREDSPWYPTLRILRQPEVGDWDSVIQQVLEFLAADTYGHPGGL